MAKITVEQSHAVMAVLATNTDWGSIDFEDSTLQELIIRNPVEAGKHFTAFLMNGGRVIVGETKIITVNRGRFNPAEFLGEGWSIITEETDEHSVALTELDLTKVEFATMLQNDETQIKGEEKLKRLKASGNIRLDADIFLTLWKNQYLIPESWKEKKVNGSIRFIFFDGTVLQNPSGGRCVLCICWDGAGWCWRYDWLNGGAWYILNPSAVLAPSS